MSPSVYPIPDEAPSSTRDKQAAEQGVLTVRPTHTVPLLNPYTLLKIRVPLVPPKPNEFDKAWFIAISRAVFGT